jgi:hypothetical protein
MPLTSEVVIWRLWGKNSKCFLLIGESLTTCHSEFLLLDRSPILSFEFEFYMNIIKLKYQYK